MINYYTKTDDYLIKRREVLMDYIEENMTKTFIDKFHDLLEVERELTLRENR